MQTKATQTKADRTKQFIIEKAAPIFNRKGFSGTSMSDILEATGLAKGGLYGNFESKEEIARAVFNYSFEIVYQGIVTAVSGKTSPLEKLLAICDYHRGYSKNSPIEGGCPVLNFGTEADDTMPALRRDIRAGMMRMLHDLERLIEKGKKLGEIRNDVNSERYASLIYGQIEGGIFMAKTLGDHHRLNQTLDFVKEIIISDLKA